MTIERELERDSWRFETSLQKAVRQLLAVLIPSIIKTLKTTLVRSDQKAHLEQYPVSNTGQQQMQRRKQQKGQATD